MPPLEPRATLVATLTGDPASGGEELSRLPAGVAWLEVRADLAGEVEASWLREKSGGRSLLYTLRSSAEGGASESSLARRRQRLIQAAAAGYDLVDLEAVRDLSPELLAEIPPQRRLLSWHGPATSLAGLQARFEAMAATPARLYKLIPAALQPGEVLAPLLLLDGLRRRDVVAFASGAAGAWTRLLAPRLGAPWVYASAGEEAAAPGQPTVAALCRDYGLPELPPVERLYGIVGNPVLHSLSPRLHNGAYRALGYPALYVPFETGAFGDFWLGVVEGTALEALGFPLAGLSVTAPFKEAALAVAGAPSPLAQRVGAANTLVLEDGVWEAESTDPQGVVGPLAARGVEPAGRVAVVAGAGGAGRAAALGLDRAGARVVLANRNRERGEKAARELGLPFLPLEELVPERFDLLVNATSLGRDPGDPLPFQVAALAPGAVVVDLVYGEQETRLVREARGRGLVVAGGREVLLHQAVPQFRMMTGQDLPLDLGRRLLDLEEEP